MLKLNAIKQGFQRTTQLADKSFVRIFENGNKAVMSKDQQILNIFNSNGELIGRKKNWDPQYGSMKEIEKDFTPEGNPKYYAYKYFGREVKANYNEKGRPKIDYQSWQFHGIPTENLKSAVEYDPSCIKYTDNICDDLFVTYEKYATKEYGNNAHLEFRQGNKLSNIKLELDAHFKSEAPRFQKTGINHITGGYNLDNLKHHAFGYKDIPIKDFPKYSIPALETGIKRGTTKEEVKDYFDKLSNAFYLITNPKEILDDKSRMQKILFKQFTE